MNTANNAKGLGYSNMVFLGGIPLDATRAEILEYLRGFDQVLHLEVAKDKKTKQLKGFAKAALKSSEGVDRLLVAPPLYLHGLEVGIKRWTNKSEYLKRKDQISKRKLYVKHHPSYNVQDLILHFSLFGTVCDIVEKTDHFTGQPRNFAYITFAKEEEAHAATQFGFINEKSQYIYCELTTPSYLMTSDCKASPCVSPTFKVPTRSTKQVTAQSFEIMESKYFHVGSLILDEGFETRSPIVRQGIGRTKCDPDKNHKKLGSHQALFNSANLLEKKRNVRTCQELDQKLSFRIDHSIKPTSSRYCFKRGARYDHGKKNLVFTGPSGDRPLARLILR